MQRKAKTMLQWAENDMSLVTLPDWRKDSEFVTQCFYDKHNNLICDWTSIIRTMGTKYNLLHNNDGLLNILESGALDQGEACLEFWYLAPVAANGSELRALLKSSAGLVEIWTSPAMPGSSWRQVFVPLNIIESGTQVVLEVVQAESKEGQVTFNRIGIRRGSCGYQCESNTELWTDESTRCLCSAGQLYCSPSQCPKGQICGPQRESSRGIFTSGTCTIHSDTDCSTFDGVLFRFMVPCTYILAKTCSPTETLPMFSVEVVNEHSGNSSLPTVQQVIVKMAKFSVYLLKRQTHRVVVNGIWKKLPLSLSSGTVTIKSNPASVVLGTSFGLFVSYDNAGAVHITLPSTYSDKMCGLCGNFNNIGRDDFRKPSSTDSSDRIDLAESWQAEETTSLCETILVPHQCDPLEEAEYASELHCGGLLSSTGSFAACLAVLGAESYFRSCVAGMCSTHGDPGVLCETLQVYADICQEAGVTVPIWRNSTFCPVQCGENSHFSSCAEGCPDVCSSQDLAGPCGSCVERCECDSGFKLSGGKCVPAEDCGCWSNGKHYEKGETFLEGECMQQCQCMGSNNVQCTTMQCAVNEVCKVKDGVKGCFPFMPATCSVYGDPHYITFDGLAYDFQGGCSYTLTTTCGGESSVQFSVTGHNMHPLLQNFTRSKLEAVTLEVEDLQLTLNQSGRVFVNHGRVQLPYSTNGAYGSIWVYMRNSYIILDTTFGLRIMIDGQNRLFLQVDESYMYELGGLCGTYSNEQEDDFLQGQNYTDPFEFGDSWRVPGNNECIVYPNDPRVCDYEGENEAYIACNALLGEAFTPCNEPIHPSTYINSCVYDYCATSGDQHTLCESLESYAAACEVAGVELPNWRNNTVCAEPPTTATLPTTPTPTSPTSDQTFCPLNCNFEKNLCGWEQLVQDSFDWTRHSGPTSSDLSGPNQDHTTGVGFYLYIEGNGITHGDSARLLSPQCYYNGPLCLHFWYHMYGSATSMALNIYLLKNNKAAKLWSMMNDQGPEWHQGNIDITDTGPFQIIVEGIRGSNALSDVAIDDISISSGSCSGIFPGMVSGTKLPPTTAVLPSLPVCNLDCSFDSNLCSWEQTITDAFDWTWQSGSTPTLMTGPSADHTGDGHYLYIEASSVTHGDTARLLSSECSISGPQCLQFWYHMYGTADTMGLHVYLLQDRKADAVWWKRNDRGNMWHRAQVDLTTTGSFQIIFEGRRGSNDQSDVAIDDVSLHHGHCEDLAQRTTPATITSSPVTTEGPDPPAANSSTAIQPLTSSTPNPQPQTTTRPQPPTETQPQPQTTRPQPPIETQPQPQTTTRPQSSTEAQPHSQTTTRPLPPTETQPQPQTTTRPQSSTEAQPHPQTTTRPQPPAETQPHPQTTTRPQPPTETQSQPQTTTRPQPPTDTQPQPQTTTRPQPSTEAQPHPQTTTRPQPPTETQPQPQTTTRSQPPTETQSQPQTTTRPQSSTEAHPHPQTTTRPQPPTETQPQPQTTTRPQSSTEAHPHPQTTTRPQPPTETQPQPQTTTRPQPPTETQPQPQTTTRPQPPTETQPQPQTTTRPQPSTEAQPHPQTTTRPQPPTETQPHPQTTTRPQPPTETQSQPQTTTRPQPPTETQPQPQTTTRPQPQTETQPQPQTTIKPHPPTNRPHPTTTTKPQTTTTAKPQPPSTPVPTPSCPENSHYTTCINACSPTCTHLHGAPHCADNEACVPGCACDDGYVLKQRVCVPIQQCGCVDSDGRKYRFNEEWYTNHCIQKCECERHNGMGKIDCDDEDECDGNAVCLQNEEGHYDCQSTGFEECTIKGDPEYRTFDNMKHDFDGEHSYVLVQTNNLPNNFPEVYIQGINTQTEDDDDDDDDDTHHGDSSSEEDSRSVRDDDDDDDKDHEEHHRLQELLIVVYNHTVQFKRNRKLVLDGKRTKTPVSPTAGLSIREHSSRIYLKTDFGLSVEFNGNSKAEIILPRLYRRKVGGLCGNFDGRGRNDRMKPDGTMAKTVQEFGESWRV
ncbi:zonadhesin [Scomber scombrus]|uniref:Zonadhesin n=1 Tax=Scomber scombrus TaxID=13677 RepID=A0AAV1PC52_SCOSC